MLQTYYESNWIVVNGKEYSCGNTHLVIAEEGREENSCVAVTWDNIDDVKIPWPWCWTIGKDGTKIFYDTDAIIRKKGKNVFYEADGDLKNVTAHCKRRAVTVSVKAILDYYDSDIAIQYLRERGLSIAV